MIVKNYHLINNTEELEKYISQIRQWWIDFQHVAPKDKISRAVFAFKIAKNALEIKKSPSDEFVNEVIKYIT